jgi:hypothetical protein
MSGRWTPLVIPVLALGLALGLSGCDLDSVTSWVGDGIGNLLKSGAEPSPGASREAPPSPAASVAQANAELLAEMFRVVFAKEPQSASEKATFFSLVGALNQGASLEGIYNGLTHSADYRKLEREKKAASPAVLNRFTELLARIEAELPEPTAFTVAAAQPLPAPVQPVFREGAQDPATPPSPPETPAKVDRTALIAEYTQLFVGAPLLTLKRVLGDEALKLVASKSAYPEKLALWYSKWAVQMAGEGVDFGLPLRSSTEEHFHYRWALKAPEDRVKWEVLNRLHRILNAAKPNPGA